MQQDSCVINREQLSLREKELKARLFGTAANGNEPLIPQPKTYVDDMDKRKQKQHEALKQGSDYLYKPQAQSSSNNDL
jgi:hypothetical protein